MSVLRSSREAIVLSFVVGALLLFSYIFLKNFESLSGLLIHHEVNGHEFLVDANISHNETVRIPANTHGLITCPEMEPPAETRWASTDDYATIPGIKIYEFVDYEAEKSGVWQGKRFGFGQSNTGTLVRLQASKTYYVDADVDMDFRCSLNAHTLVLLGHWPIEENGGTVMHDIAQARHGTYTGSVVWTTSTLSSSQLAINTKTITGAAVLPNIPQFNFDMFDAFSLSFYMRRTPLASQDAFFVIDAPGTAPGWAIGSLGGGNIGMTFNLDRAVAYTPPGVVQSNENFSKYLVTYDGSGMATGIKIYVDGQAKSLTTASNPVRSSDIQNDLPISFGLYNVGYEYDEIRLYRGVARPEDIQETTGDTGYNSSSSSSTTSPVAGPIVNEDGTISGNGCGEPSSQELPFALHYDEPADRPGTIKWPVTVGVPFKNGDIEDDTPLTITTDGISLPTQYATLAHWRVDNETPQWSLLDFQETFGEDTLPCNTVTTENSLAPVAPIVIDNTNDKINVDTGVVQFSVPKNNFSVMSLLRSQNQTIVDGSTLYWIDDANGEEYTAEEYGTSEVSVETAGPMRAVILAEGWYQMNGGSAQKMKYQVRITAFAGLPYVRVYHTLIWTEEETTVMREFGMRLHLANGATNARIGIENSQPVSINLGQQVEALQQSYSSGYTIVDGVRTTQPRLAGWVTAESSGMGLGVALRDMAYQVPKAFTMTANDIKIQLWAPQAGPMSMRMEDRMTPEVLATLNPEWTSSGLGRPSPVGVAKTHEMWLWPVTSQAAQPQVINDMVQRPPAVVADPVYMGTTNAIPNMRPRSETPEQYSYIERRLDDMFRFVLHRYESMGDYDMWNIGDVHLFCSCGWRTWDQGGYHWPILSWMQYYRSGKRMYLEEGERNARHVMDVNTVQHGTASGGTVGAKVRGWSYTYSALPWGWGPHWDGFHNHPQFMMYYYYMTGYERARETLLSMAKVNQGGAGTQNPNDASRELYGQIEPKITYYEFTGDPQYLTYASSWTNAALAAYDAAGGFFPNNNFWGFFWRGLEHVHMQTDDSRIQNALISLVSPFAAAPSTSYDAPTWYRESLLPFAYAYRKTQNTNYLRYGMWRTTEQLQRVSTNPVWDYAAGAGGAFVSRVYYPVFMGGALDVLGAWHDAGFPDLDLENWPGNAIYFGSTPIDQNGMKSELKFYVRKDVNVAGDLKITTKDTNIGIFEQLGSTGSMTVTTTKPNGDVTTAPLLPGVNIISFPANDPPGTYAVTLRGTQQLLWASAQTTLPGLVTEIMNNQLNYNTFREPASVYIRPGKTATSIGIQNLYFGAWVRSLDGTLLAALESLFSSTMRTLSIADPSKMLVVDVPYLDASVNSWAGLPRIRFNNISPFMSVTPEQWFSPLCGNGAVTAGEQCDDGNQASGDGCSSLCVTE